MEKKDKAFLSKIRTNIGKTIDAYHLVNKDDKILVGLSGGKDSFILLENLAWRKKVKQEEFEIIAVYIDILNIPYEANINYLKNFCAKWNVPFIHKKLQDDVDVSGSEKTPCFVCSWDRRKHLFRIAEELKCNKLALGHHLDDAIETLLMNMMYQANISSIPPILKMFDGDLFAIRPLIETKESNLIKYAEIQEYQTMIKTCPFEKVSSRQFVRDILQELENKYDRAKNNIYRSMLNINKEYLP